MDACHWYYYSTSDGVKSRPTRSTMNELALGSSSGAMYGSVAERLWRTSVRCGLGVAGLAALTAVLDRLHFRSALLYLIIVVFVSLTGDFVASAVVSLGALLCLSYFLSPPGFLLGLDQPLNLVAPLRNEQGEVVRWYGVSIDIEDRKLAEAMLAGEKRLLEMMARGDALGLILDALCRLVEEQSGNVLCSVLMLDPDGIHLRHGAAPSLPRSYTDAVDGLAIGPGAGSCGTAAYRAERVVVSDIATDPLWADYRELALAHSLRACWSTPMLSSDGRVVGTFAMYYREPRLPPAHEHDIIGRITPMAAVAVERAHAEEALRQP